jgi:hypothetical protein
VKYTNDSSVKREWTGSGVRNPKKEEFPHENCYGYSSSKKTRILELNATPCEMSTQPYVSAKVISPYMGRSSGEDTYGLLLRKLGIQVNASDPGHFCHFARL